MLMGEYDAADPWSQRFVCKTDGKQGDYYFDLEGMCGLETEAGRIFVQMVKESATTGKDSNKHSSQVPVGIGLGAAHSRPKQALAAGHGRAQYTPFRKTFVEELQAPIATPYAYDLAEREGQKHWSKGGTVFSSAPRFPYQKPGGGQTFEEKAAEELFNLPHQKQKDPAAIMDAVRSARIRRRRCAMGLTAAFSTANATINVRSVTPGPCKYQPYRDVWTPQEVCGAIPPSSVFAPSARAQSRQEHRWLGGPKPPDTLEDGCESIYLTQTGLEQNTGVNRANTSRRKQRPATVPKSHSTRPRTLFTEDTINQKERENRHFVRLPLSRAKSSGGARQLRDVICSRELAVSLQGALFAGSPKNEGHSFQGSSSGKIGERSWELFHGESAVPPIFEATRATFIAPPPRRKPHSRVQVPDRNSKRSETR